MSATSDYWLVVGFGKSGAGANRVLPVSGVHREAVYQPAVHAVTQSRPRGSGDRAIPTDFHFRLDDVLAPVALAGGDVAWERESRQGGHRNVVAAAHAGL